MKSTPDFDIPLKTQPAAAEFVHQQIDAAVATSQWLSEFQGRLKSETGTRLVDWLDYLVVADTPANVEALGRVGYVIQSSAGQGALPQSDQVGAQASEQANADESRSREDAACKVYEQPLGIFPQLIVGDTDQQPVLGIKVESLSDFIAVHQSDIRESDVQGREGEQFRWANLAFNDGSRVGVVERHGYRGFVPGDFEDATASDVAKSLESFRNRRRDYNDPKSCFDEAFNAFQNAASQIGKNRACDVFFQAEREYWQSKNHAARVQYQRQQSLGLGWANHDHHTYRCSRQWFAPLIHFLEAAGFHCRERFYAGKDAGWGAQVLEHTESGIVIFADVDMSEDELTGDFAHDGLAASSELGTVGLWCRLHGDSFVSAGMHHLECQFDFDAAREQLSEAGVSSMKPFTDFPHLKQAFTTGERWQVPMDRLQALTNEGVISSEEADRFAKEGVIGSHLEILERNDGYKGFNQTGISEIILQTNPKNEI